MGSLVASRAPTLIRCDLRIASGSQWFEPCQYCDNTLSPPHPVGGRASQTVSPGSPVAEYPPQKKNPKSTLARRRPGEGAPSDEPSCVTGGLLAQVEGLEATLAPHPLIPFVPLGPSENPFQTPSKDSRKTLLRHPQRTIGKPSSDSLKRHSENPPLRAHGAQNPDDDRGFEYRLE